MRSDISISLCCCGRFLRRLPRVKALTGPCACGDPAGYELSVVLDEAEQRRAARVLPLQAERVEPRDLGHAAALPDAALVVGERQVKPAVVVAEAGGPDDAVDIELTSVGERHRLPRRVGGAPVREDAEPLCGVGQAPDQRFLLAHAPAD